MIIAITGGIGAGKSVVSRILLSLGYSVYDCDAEAKLLMESDWGIRKRILEEISDDAFDENGHINRRKLSECVFSNPEKLKILNLIVHKAVRNHFLKWAKRHKSKLIFIETAILYESRFNELVDDVWEVTAPYELRIARVINRNGFTREEVEKRIAAQCNELNPRHQLIVNDGETPLIPQVLQLLKRY
ncbi:MAG: dephospho-CoA kinase [Bacteroides sp.]|nr:dephospho-CoA kinase [Bacteroides sp.]MCM1378708.1 dephospho-CoA kinase [Bacteroides sp.]MCM1444981.1 dephospho-CoA kinase [Prevotella sp.]